MKQTCITVHNYRDVNLLTYTILYNNIKVTFCFISP